MKKEDLIGKYWHKLTNEEFDFLFSGGVTWGWVLENIKQPNWCYYHQALYNQFGCTSLVSYRERINEEYCGKCDLYKTGIYE